MAFEGDARRRERYQDGTWVFIARCRGMNPKVFFPADEAGTAYAKSICRECEVREECLEYNLSTRSARDDEGVFAGMTLAQRNRLRKARRRQQQERQQKQGKQQGK
jgi:WhiB family redox-sensing transcriptional regulator